MEKKYNCLIIGHNTSHAKIFSFFCEKVILLVNKSEAEKRSSNELNNYSVIFSNPKKKRLFKRIRRIKEIKNIIIEHNINIVFSNRKDDMIYAKLATVFQKKKPLLLVTFHNSLAFLNKRKVKFLSKMVKLCSDGFVCLAKFVYDLFIEYKTKENRILYLPNSIDASLIEPKKDYSFEDDICKIVSCGVINPNKNQEFLIEIISRIPNRKKIVAYLIGDYDDKEYLSKLETIVKQKNLENNVIFMGKVDNFVIKETICNYDIFVSSSLTEMSPYSILEAKAAGLPIVASTAYGQRDLITDHIDGLLFDNNDSDKALELIESLINDKKLRISLGKNARKISSEECSCYNSSRILLNFIDGLGGKKQWNVKK